MSAKEQDRSSEGSENPLWPTQKVKLSTDMAYFAKQIKKIDDDAYQWEYVNKHP